MIALKKTDLRALLIVALLMQALILSACASMRFGNAAALRIDCNVPEAAVYIDDVFMGRASEWMVDGRFVKPGFHRIELRHPEHFPHYEEIKLAKGDAVLLELTLRPLLD